MSKKIEGGYHWQGRLWSKDPQVIAFLKALAEADGRIARERVLYEWIVTRAKADTAEEQPAKQSRAGVLKKLKKRRRK